MCVCVSVLGIISHLHLCIGCDWCVGVSCSGVVCVELPIGGTHHLEDTGGECGEDMAPPPEEQTAPPAPPTEAEWGFTATQVLKHSEANTSFWILG